MHISKNILRGVLLGLSTISLATTPSDATAQKTKKVAEKIPQPKDTVVRVDCYKFNPKPDPADLPQAHPTTSQVRAVVSDSTDVIYKAPCVTCGRG